MQGHREKQDVDTVYAMRKGPAKWSDVVKMMDKAAS